MDKGFVCNRYSPFPLPVFFICVRETSSLYSSLISTFQGILRSSTLVVSPIPGLIRLISSIPYFPASFSHLINPHSWNLFLLHSQINRLHHKFCFYCADKIIGKISVDQFSIIYCPMKVTFPYDIILRNVLLTSPETVAFRQELGIRISS